MLRLLPVQYLSGTRPAVNGLRPRGGRRSSKSQPGIKKTFFLQRNSGNGNGCLQICNFIFNSINLFKIENINMNTFKSMVLLISLQNC